ncbi:hypothetical protein E3N88_19346 [Mikania micrantha]|uniref:Uncharacterized protein n=1 Tax=Mikania micrantha TaxID=192012 RepID=A0A5N6NPK7_9ASTR|nr:hypothetical protein E3N88_19346 [Mikania micrantha]
MHQITYAPREMGVREDAQTQRHWKMGIRKSGRRSVLLYRKRRVDGTSAAREIRNEKSIYSNVGVAVTAPLPVRAPLHVAATAAAAEEPKERLALN